MAGFYRGSTPTLVFKPIEVSVTDSALGVPTIAIEQELALLVFDGDRLTVDGEANTVSVTLTEAESVQLVSGVPTTAQLAFSNEETGTVVRLPTHAIDILHSVLDTLLAGSEVIDDGDDEDAGTDDEGSEDTIIEDPEDTILPDGEELMEDYDLDDFVEYYEDEDEEDTDLEELNEAEDPDDVEPASEEE